MQKLYDALKNKGFNIVSVNYRDSAETITKYVEKEKFTFPIVMNGKDQSDVVKAYGVMAYPTNYVLDSKGKIVARFVGFNQKGILDALKRLGLEMPEEDKN